MKHRLWLNMYMYIHIDKQELIRLYKNISVKKLSGLKIFFEYFIVIANEIWIKITKRKIKKKITIYDLLINDLSDFEINLYQVAILFLFFFCKFFVLSFADKLFEEKLDFLNILY